MGKVAASPLPLWGSPPLQSTGQNQKCPTKGQGGYISPAAWQVPTASKRGAESEVAHKWARWLNNPYRLEGPHRFKAGGRIGSGPQVATQPLPPRGSPPLQSRGQNPKWPTSGQGGYISPAAWGVPTASEQGAESEVAHKWARWLHKPCRLGGPHRFRAGRRIRQWPTPAALGVPTAAEHGAESEVPHKGARWIHKPCRLAGPHRFKAGGRIRSGSQVGKVAKHKRGAESLPPGKVAT